jgi:uncharacterized protein YecT (DUF1311 family)
MELLLVCAFLAKCAPEPNGDPSFAGKAGESHSECSRKNNLPGGKSVRDVRFMWLARAAVAAAMFVACLSHSVPALAIDCTRATHAVEKRICASRSLQSADAQMNAAYMKLLKAAPDPDIRDALVRSQRRWIAARNRLDTDFEGDPLDAGEIRKAILERTSVLVDGPDNSLIANAEAERKWLASYGQGPFSGFHADCGFFPDDHMGEHVSYMCFGAVSVQNHDRVCSQNQDWASWRMYQYRSVSRVEGNKASTTAYCDNQPNSCDNGSAQAGWSRSPSSGNDGEYPVVATGQPQLDVEMWPLNDDDAAWFNGCLTASRYPAF